MFVCSSDFLSFAVINVSILVYMESGKKIPKLKLSYKRDTKRRYDHGLEIVNIAKNNKQKYFL